MGVVLMSKRELNRIDILARLDGGRLTTAAAADLMRVSLRQTHRLLKRYRDGGASAITNRRRGRPSNNRLPDVVRDHAGELIQIDGSDHRWFEDRAAPCTLLVFIDDATSRLMELRFVASESTFAYFET